MYFFFFLFFFILFYNFKINTHFKKASDLLHSKNNITITNELKEKLACLNDAKLSQIHKTSKISKSSISKETYEWPSVKTLQKYVTTSKPDNTNKNT